MQELASALADFLMTLARASHGQSRKHVDVVACEIKADQALKDDGPPWKRDTEEN